MAALCALKDWFPFPEKFINLKIIERITLLTLVATEAENQHIHHVFLFKHGWKSQCSRLY